MRYWVWISLGMILAICEIFVPNFVIIWFGLGAICVGLLVAVASVSLKIQLIIWALSSLAFVGLWFLFIKPRMRDQTKAGLSREVLVGAVGQIIEAPRGAARGKIRFPIPLLGAEEWPCLAEEGQAVSVGDRVEVTEISGNTLIIRPKGGKS